MTSHPIWAEIDLAAIDHNLRALRKLTDPKVQMLASVKANAYGHGMVQVANQAIKSGVNMLGVARFGEGVLLRDAGIKAPILIFGHTPPDAARILLANDLIPTLASLTEAEVFSNAASHAGGKLTVHIKVDTGMGRIGLLADSLRPAHGEPSFAMAEDEIEKIVRLPGLAPEGIYTHFAGADLGNKTGARKQFERFTDLLARLSKRGTDFPIRHAANSAAIIDMPETHLDLVRPGISIYGLYPSEEVLRERISLKPAMALKARIAQLKRVPAGFQVSYGSTYTTAAPTVIATIPVGYADGFRRLLSSRGQMLVCGQRAPVVGRVCMDLTMLDVGHIPDLDPDAEVVILGRQGDEAIWADEIAGLLGTINYEVVSTVMARVPRVYLNASH